MATNSSQAIKLFYCYARKDHALRDELDVHLAGLRRSGLIAAWYDGEISPGTSWEKEIETQLDTAQVILLLVSPDFIHSDYCYSKEMARAIERHHAEEARVIPILLRPADWIGTPFSTLQMLPSNTRPVTRWSDRDAAFEDVAKGIRKVVNDLLSQRITAPDPSISAASTKLPPRAVSSEEPQREQRLFHEELREASLSTAATPSIPSLSPPVQPMIQASTSQVSQSPTAPVLPTSPHQIEHVELTQPPGGSQESAPTQSPGLVPNGQPRIQTKYSISRRTFLIGLASAGTIAIGAAFVATLRLPQGRTQQSTSSPTPTSMPLPPGTVLYRYRGHQQTYVADVAWSYNSRRIASADATNKTVHVWDALDGRNVYIYGGHHDYLNFACWSPDDKRIASAGGGYEVHVWDQADGGHLYVYRGHISDSDTSNGSVTALAWSPNGKYIASSYDATGPGNHGAVHVWSPQNGSLVHMYRGQIDQIGALSWSPDSQRLVSASADRTIQVWQAVSGKLLFANPGNAWALAWSPNGKYIAVGNNDNNTVEIWDANNNTVMNIYRGHRDVLYCLSWSPDSLMVASGSRDQTFQIWKALDSHLVLRLSITPANLGGPEPIAWSPDGKMIASVSDSELVEVWIAPH